MGKAARNSRRAREKRIEDRYVRELAVADAYWDQWYERAEPVVPVYEPPNPKLHKPSYVRRLWSNIRDV